MKKLLPLLAIALIGNSCFAQANGTIVGFSVNPTNPTPTDNIEIFVDLSFPNGGCELDNSNFGINGNTIGANAHHCVGLLAVICPNTDTFQIGQLSAGTYTFDFTLTSGAGFPSCSPGIVPDDNDQFQFTVSNTVGIKEESNNEIDFYPNPSKGLIQFSQATESVTRVENLHGQTVCLIPAKSRNFNIDFLPSGIYFSVNDKSKSKLIKR